MHRGALLLVALVAFVACGGGAPTIVETNGGDVRFTVEVADSPEERERGLMERESLPADAGMLFVYEEPARGGFWMKDTPIPLSIAFLDGDGRVLRILDMEPCRSDPCPFYDPGICYRSALEVNRGAFERLGIEVGDSLEVRRG